MKLINFFFLALGLGAFVLSGYLAIRPSSRPHSNNTGFIQGSYFGTYTNQFSQSASFAYRFTDHNFMCGAADLSSEPTSFGSYSGNSDAVQMNAWNSINKNYYAFQGKFSEDKSTIIGTYQNLTTRSEHGTFKLVKQ